MKEFTIYRQGSCLELKAQVGRKIIIEYKGLPPTDCIHVIAYDEYEKVVAENKAILEAMRLAAEKDKILKDILDRQSEWKIPLPLKDNK